VPLIIKDGANQTPHLQGNVRGAPILIPAGELVVDTPKDKDKSSKGESPGNEDVVKGPLDKDDKNSIGMAFKRIVKGKTVEFMMGATGGPL